MRVEIQQWIEIIQKNVYFSFQVKIQLLCNLGIKTRRRYCHRSSSTRWFCHYSYPFYWKRQVDATFQTRQQSLLTWSFSS